jgi:F0F1-type ATP synthase gamma subunit
MKELLETSTGVSHPYLRDVAGKRPLYVIVISGDKGLCGSYNIKSSGMPSTHYQHEKRTISTMGIPPRIFSLIGMTRILRALQRAGSRAFTGALLVRDIMDVFDTGETDEGAGRVYIVLRSDQETPVMRRLYRSARRLHQYRSAENS